MRHGRRRGRLGLVSEHRRALIRNLAKSLITRQQIMTTHAKAKETSRFVDRLVTLAKTPSLNARRQIVRQLGSGSEALAKRVIDQIAPKMSDRKGGYTRVLRYGTRNGDGASLSLVSFTIPFELPVEKKRKRKKEKKPVVSEAKKEKPSTAAHAKEDVRKETPKKGGFLSSLRRFLKGDDDKKK